MANTKIGFPFIFSILLFVNEVLGYGAWYGILKTRSGEQKENVKKFCFLYYQNLTKVASNESSVDYYPVEDATDWDACNNDTIPSTDISNKFAFISKNNCSSLEQALHVQNAGGAGALIVSSVKPPSENATNVSVIFAFVSNNTYNTIMADEDNVELGLYAPEDTFFLNYSLIVIWALAVFTVTIGSFWSGEVRYKLYLNEQGLSGSGSEGGRRGGRVGDSNQERPLDAIREETSLNISVKFILFFVIMMCTMLLCLYFLYDYLVYLIMALFCIASTGAMYSCLLPIVQRIPCGKCRTPHFSILIARGTMEAREILLLLFSLGFAITWFVLRKEPYAWVLQDILGIFFSVNMLKVLRLPSLKICTILLVALFVYDIFFVFITPLLTSDGRSIMVEVAQGSSSNEQLPMVLKVPHFVYSEIVDVCQLQAQNYNILGFGDILVPGLLVSYVHAFDLQMGTPKRLYFVVNVVAYGLGLLTTFLGLLLMQGAQPALLYLVPFTLIPTVCIAACRGELHAMWKGDSEKFECEGEEEVLEDELGNGQPQLAT